MSELCRPEACENGTSPRSGVTLLELLVVIVIILMLTSITIPVMAPALKGRQLREAARLVSTFLSNARGRAMQMNKPVGVMIERIDGLQEASMSLSLAEVPPPYTGSYTHSTVMAASDLGPSFSNVDPRDQYVHWDVDMRQIGYYELYNFVWEYDYLAKTFYPWPNFLQDGDLLKVNYQGNYYEMESYLRSSGERAFRIGMYNDITRQDNFVNGFWSIFSETATQNQGPLLVGLPGQPFQIYRQPTKMSGGSMQLPDSVVIDLNFSGESNKQFPFAPRGADSSGNIIDMWSRYDGYPAPMRATFASKPVIIMFNPNGSVEQVWAPVPPNANNVTYRKFHQWHWKGVRPASPVHLLIGKRERVPIDPTQSGKDGIGTQAETNWLDPESLWVTVTPTTGLVSTAENYAGETIANGNKFLAQSAPTMALVGPQNPPTGWTPSAATPYSYFSQLRVARKFALEAISMGGR